MTNTQPAQDHLVSITYGDGTHLFRLARGATLGDLAGHVSGLDALHVGAPLTIDVIVETQRTFAPPALKSHTSH